MSAQPAVSHCARHHPASPLLPLSCPPLQEARPARRGCSGSWRAARMHTPGPRMPTRFVGGEVTGGVAGGGCRARGTTLSQLAVLVLDRGDGMHAHKQQRRRHWMLLARVNLPRVSHSAHILLCHCRGGTIAGRRQRCRAWRGCGSSSWSCRTAAGGGSAQPACGVEAVSLPALLSPFCILCISLTGHRCIFFQPPHALSGGCREGFVGLSAADTIRQCLRLGLKDQAQKLAREFKVGCA